MPVYLRPTYIDMNGGEVRNPAGGANSLSYLISRVGSTYYAKNGKTGIVNSGASAPALIQGVFNTNPDRVFFKAETYPLGGATLTCASPVILYGEGNSKTIFENGTISITEGAWTDTGTVVKDLGFTNTGDLVGLHFTKVINGYVQRVKIYKTSYVTNVPSLWLTSCDCFRIEDNWFDGYQMQIIKIDGNESKSLPVHIIQRNDFGSTATAFPAYTNHWEVAAIYIADATQDATLIKDNIVYLNPENCFVYSIANGAYGTWVIDNNMSAGIGKYMIDLMGVNNKIRGNYIEALTGTLGAINIRGAACDRTLIENNHIFMDDGSAFTGIIYHSVISGNIIHFSAIGLDLTDCGYNIISNNRFIQNAAGAHLAIKEAGGAAYNLFVGNYLGYNGAYLNVTAVSSSVYKHNFGYITENNGSFTGNGVQQSIEHGCNFTPTEDEVFLSERLTGGALARQSAVPNGTYIYITATNGKDYNWKVSKHDTMT